ncbi:MAG: aminotransferase class I/II-fold pyridoxal phosphate-dependent enzyme [Geminicoccaceae bacterium]|nr:aminotransferase class I/II-fold pyridoxal phosphate-dependent enzyme [Geminicoccaceae bacterium]
MDIFDKHQALAQRRGQLLGTGADPFDLEIEALHGPCEATIRGRRTILVGTNNYLGLTFDPDCIEAGCEALRRFGTGTTGSRIANGTYAAHRALEAEIAAFMGRARAIVFTTGYQANLATISALAGAKDIVFVDSDWHASIFDGCRLSGATVVRFRHNDPEDLDRRLERNPNPDGCRLIVVEGLYSMLGDVARLREIVAVKKRHGAFLLVDEAHSMGVFGDKGRGVAEAQGVEAEVDFIVGTFSKSLGAIGGFAVSDHPRFDLLRVAARPYMFTASPGPATIATVRAALAKIAAHPELRARIWDNARRLHAGLTALGFALAAPPGPILSIRLPDERTTVFAWNRLLELGVYVNLALPPGTPGGVCLLRGSVSAAHTTEQIDRVLDRFARLAEELGRFAASVAAA